MILEVAKLILKAPNPDNGTKFIYSLTERGKDLIPVMLEIVSWSGKHDPKRNAKTDCRQQAGSDQQDSKKTFICLNTTCPF